MCKVGCKLLRSRMSKREGRREGGERILPGDTGRHDVCVAFTDAFLDLAGSFRSCGERLSRLVGGLWSR